jgi:hypothetical protein
LVFVHARSALEPAVNAADTEAMPEARRLLVPLLAIAAALVALHLARGTAEPAPAHDALGEVDGARFRLSAGDPGRAPVLGDDVRRATLTFAPTVAPSDRRAVLDAVAAARPEARGLIDAVDGLVDVRVADPGPGVAGNTLIGRPRYVVTLDLRALDQHFGARGITRVVLHELGHVIDHALVPRVLERGLDAGIPRGYGCHQGVSGACANAEERFAETFAKWATGDIGLNLDVGYKVMPPAVPLDAWGAPLARLGQAGA